jgi:hypothetical protein
MAPLLLELSSLEVESLRIVVDTPEQERSLDTLAGGEIAALLADEGIFPINKKDKHCGVPGCCCFPIPTCLPIG